MALTLRAAIDDKSSYLEMLGDDDLEPGYVQIGTEYLKVLGTYTGVPDFAEAPFRQVTVQRGELGSMAAAHSQGDTVTSVVVAVQTSSPTAPPPSEVGAGGEQTIYTYTTVLTNAQILDLVGNPQDLVPAAGEGLAIIPMAAFAYMNVNHDNARVYTNVDDAAKVHLVIGSAGDLPDFGTDWLFKDTPGVLSWWFNATNGDDYFYAADIGNQPIQLRATNAAAGNFTGGHAENTLTVTVHYLLAEVPTS